MLAVSPAIGNMMRLQQNSTKDNDDGDLATKLFWQTDRFAPLQLSRNKSHPVAHLTPRLMGILWQVAAQGVKHHNKSASSETIMKEQKALLQRAGIRSNHVHDEWTGVSMARWMSLLSSLRQPPQQNRPMPVYPPLTIAPWLAALWQMARTKDDLLEFLLAMEEYGGDGVAAECGIILDSRNELSRALRHDVGARQEWARSSFTADEITPDCAHEALDRLVSSSSHDVVADGSRHDNDSGRLVEVIAASRAIQHAAQPVVPNGRYGYDGGRPKSDCVEVVVREVLNIILWDESRACFDLSRWPYRPSDELVQLYGPEQQQGHHRPVVDMGQLWFNVLSNRPGCDYLAVSPQGQAYELTPTMANVARVVQQLLLGGGLDHAGTEWTTLEELARTWNDARRANTPRLTVTSSQRSFRPPLSDQLVHEEHATLFFDGSKYGITIKLDQRREFATVAHVRLRTDRIDEGLLTRLRQVSLQNPTDVTWTLLCLAIMGDHGLGQKEDDDAAPTRSTSCHHDENASRMAVMMDLLAAPFGPDRRELMELAGTSDLEVEDRAHAQALRMSRNVLAQSVARVCGERNLEESLREDLLSWLLQESPCVLPEQAGKRLSYDPRVEDELLRLSPAALARLALKSGDWACRDGAALAHVVQYQLGMQSSRHLVFQDVHGNPSGLSQIFSKLMYYIKLRGLRE
jgi:hypothetical protein